MITQNYLMINESSNIVDNICLWDGDTSTWQPPSNTLMLVQETTPAMIWQINSDKTAYVLTEAMGKGDIGFTWDGSAVITNKPQPQPPTPAENQPITNGVTTI